MNTVNCHAGVIADYKRVKFMTPITKVDKENTIKLKDAVGITGVIASPRNIFDNSEAGYSSYITLKKVLDGKVIGDILLPYKSSLSCFDIQVSPNGKYVLFKLGTYGDIYDSFRIYIWNLSSNTVDQVTQSDLTYYPVSWSPSSKYIAYLEGGDMFGGEYGIAGIYRPLKLFVYDVEKKANRYIARGQSLRYFTWSGKDSIFYNQTAAEHARTENDPSDKSLHLQGKQNIYETFVVDGATKLLISGAKIQIVSDDRSKVLFLNSHNPDQENTKDNDENDTPTSYRYLCLFDTLLKKTTKLEISGFEPSFAKFTKDNNQLIYCVSNYRNKTGTLTVMEYDFPSQRILEIAKVEEKDSEDFHDRAAFQPQFNVYWLSSDEKQLVFYSEHQGEKIGENRYLFPVKLNLVDITTKNVKIICEDVNNFSLTWGTLYK